MRCWRARRKLNNFSFEKSEIAKNKDLVAHLEICPKCYSLVSAEEILRLDLQSAAIDDAEETVSWSALKSQVNSKAALPSLLKNKENNLMVAFSNFYAKRSKISISMTAIAVILLLSVVIPVSYNESIGYEVAFAGVDKNLAMDVQKIKELLHKLQIEGVAIDVSECEATCKVHFSDLKSTDDAELLIAAFQQIGNIELLNPIQEVYETTSGNIFTQIRTKVESIGDHFEFILAKEDLDSDFQTHKVLLEILGNDETFEIWISDDNENLPLDSGSHRFYFSNDTSNVSFDNIVERIDENGNTFLVVNPGTPDEHILDFVEGHKNELFILEFKEGKLENSSDSSDTDENIKVAKELPAGYELSQNYPNPFNPTTTIDYAIPKSQHVTIEVINLMGQVVTTLVDEIVSAGQHSVEWDATNESGTKVATGMYFYKFSSGELNQIKKMVLMK